MTAMLLALACRPDPREAARPEASTSTSDGQHAALVAAFSTPGVWEGPTGRFEVTADRRLVVAFADGQAWDLALISPDSPHFVAVQQTEPRMPLHAPAWVDAAGAVHLGTFFSNRVGVGLIDDAGHAVLRWTPMHRLVVDPGPRCRWESDLARRETDVPCAAIDATHLRFTVPEADQEPWSGEHVALTWSELGVIAKEELPVFTRAR